MASNRTGDALKLRVNPRSVPITLSVIRNHSEADALALDASPDEDVRSRLMALKEEIERVNSHAQKMKTAWTARMSAIDSEMRARLTQESFPEEAPAEDVTPPVKPLARCTRVKMGDLWARVDSLFIELPNEDRKSVV